MGSSVDTQETDVIYSESMVERTPLQDLIRSAGVTQAELAEALGTTQPNISRKLAGHVWVQVPEVAVIADVLADHGLIINFEDLLDAAVRTRGARLPQKAEA